MFNNNEHFPFKNSIDTPKSLTLLGN